MFRDLGLFNLDIAEWPVTQFWSSTWKGPSGNPFMMQVPYAGLDIFSFDLNNQRWPTGVETPRVYDPATDSYKNYFDETDVRHNQSWCFRVALARLTNKPAWTPTLTKSVDSFVPDPAAAGWIWPGFRQTPALTYDLPYGLGPEPYHHDFNSTRAKEILDAAGFTQTWYGDPDGAGPLDTGYWREDPLDPGNPLPVLDIYAPIGDSLRQAYATSFKTELISVGIPTNFPAVNEYYCIDRVNILYDFHIYIDGRCWGPDPSRPRLPIRLVPLLRVLGRYTD